MSLQTAPTFRRSLSIALILAAVSAAALLTTASKADQPKQYTAEQIVESAIAVAGNGFGRILLAQIRKNGLEIGRETRMRPDGRPEESRYELRFIHGDKPEKDKVRLDSKTPQAEYSLVWGEGRVFGIINGASFTPRAEASAETNNRASSFM